MRFYNFSEIRAKADCAAMARDLYGALVINGRCAATWRGGDNPEAVSIEREKWFDHVAKCGGGPVELAAFRFGNDKQAAQEFLGDLLGLTPAMQTGPAPEPTDCRHARLLADGYAERARYEDHGIAWYPAPRSTRVAQASATSAFSIPAYSGISLSHSATAASMSACVMTQSSSLIRP